MQVIKDGNLGLLKAILFGRVCVRSLLVNRIIMKITETMIYIYREEREERTERSERNNRGYT